jgi:hypothetical protein
MLLFISGTIALAQTFSSGSTGTDGALDLTSGDRTVVVPASGVLNYTTINVPAGRTLTFQNNLAITPVIMLAQGGVTIAGTVNICASGNVPGPGGFYGGYAASYPASGGPGLGPGGGTPNAAGTQTQGNNGTWVGPLTLVPIIGGSGGGGGYCCVGCFYGPYSAAGGAGGGAITIASSTSITLTGSILANGSTAPNQICTFPGYCFDCPGAAGSSGAVRLVANTLSVSGNISAAIVRLEGQLGQVSYSGSGTAPVVSSINPLITPTHPPSITILSIGGYPVPSYSGSSFSTIDLLLPTQLTDPIPVVVQGTNIPVGSPVTVNFSGAPNATSTTTTLAGTSSSSTATLYVSNLNRSGVSYLFVSATFDPTLIALNLKQSGPDAVTKMEVATAPGEKPQYRFYRRDGSLLPLNSLPAELRRVLGL